MYNINFEQCRKFTQLIPDPNSVILNEFYLLETTVRVQRQFYNTATICIFLCTMIHCVRLNILINLAAETE